MVEAFLALTSIASIVASVDGRALLGFIWLLFPVFTVLSGTAFVVCRSLAFAWGWPVDEVDILSACSCSCELCALQTFRPHDGR